MAKNRNKKWEGVDRTALALANKGDAQDKARSTLNAKTAVMKQRNRQTLKNSTAEKRDHLVDSNKPKGGADKALEAKAAKEASKSRVGTKKPSVGRAALGIGGLAALGAIAGKAYGDRKKDEGGKATYSRAGAMYNGASPEQADKIASSVQMLEDKKKGKPVAKKEVAKTAVAKGKTPASTGPRQTPEKKAEASKAKPSTEYKSYKKDSAEAKDFRSAFAAARKAGKGEFTWQGRKYNTKIKK